MITYVCWSTLFCLDIGVFFMLSVIKPMTTEAV